MIRSTPPADLLALSRALAADPELVQAAGGNTSVKDDRSMWVKASGARLGDVDEQHGFVRLDLQRLEELRQGGDFEDVGTAVLDAPAGQRPSIETWLHAALPHPVVAHVHSTAAVAATLAGDPEPLLGQVLGEHGWSWSAVPYRRPGTPLAEAVTALGEPAPDVVVLGNHGIVVGADSGPAAGMLAQEVHAALRGALPDRRSAAAAPAQHSSVPRGWRWSDEPKHTALADPETAGRLRVGAWCPDQVVFLGPTPRLLELPEGDQPVAVVPGRGVLVSDALSESARALLDFLADVARHLDGPVVRALTAADEAELLGWDAEHHRQQAARDRG